jgi:hypothetical protein
LLERSLILPTKSRTIEFMKTTLEIPDAVFRRAKSEAAKRGMPLRQLVTEAIEDKLKAPPAGGRNPG